MIHVPVLEASFGLFFRAKKHAKGYVILTIRWPLHPLKINMEPKSEGFEDDLPFQMGDFRLFRFHVTLPETNSLYLKMDDWKATFLWGPGPFSGAMLPSRELTYPPKMAF